MELEELRHFVEAHRDKIPSVTDLLAAFTGHFGREPRSIAEAEHVLTCVECQDWIQIWREERVKAAAAK